MKILYVSTKEDIELFCPPNLDFIMKWIWKYLKVKSVKRKRGHGLQIKSIIYDEFNQL